MVVVNLVVLIELKSLTVKSVRVHFQIELLAVYLIRWFTIDLAEHLARKRGGDKAVKFEPHIRQFIGVGNATGLGMAPFLLKPPCFNSQLGHCQRKRIGKGQKHGNSSQRHA